MNRQIVVNTIVFAEQATVGERQESFLAAIHSLGLSVVEIRREMFADFSREMSSLVQTATAYQMDLFYSVPEPLFRNGCFDQVGVEKYLSEATALQVKLVKFNVGDFDGASEAEWAKLKETVSGKNFTITVENDQTPQNGSAEPLARFMKNCARRAIPIFFTYDVGNWAWNGEDPVKNVGRFAEQVRYIHLKDVCGTGKNAVARALDDGELAWRDVLARLPKAGFWGIEYPGGNNPVDAIKRAVKKLSVELNSAK